MSITMYPNIRSYPILHHWHVYHNVSKYKILPHSPSLACLSQCIQIQDLTPFSIIGMSITMYPNIRSYPILHHWHVYHNVSKYKILPHSPSLACLSQCIQIQDLTPFSIIGMSITMYPNTRSHSILPSLACLSQCIQIQDLTPFCHHWHVYHNVSKYKILPHSAIIGMSITMYPNIRSYPHSAIIGMSITMYPNIRSYPILSSLACLSQCIQI